MGLKILDLLEVGNTIGVFGDWGLLGVCGDERKFISEFLVIVTDKMFCVAMYGMMTM